MGEHEADCCCQDCMGDLSGAMAIIAAAAPLSMEGTTADARGTNTLTFVAMVEDRNYWRERALAAETALSSSRRALEEARTDTKRLEFLFEEWAAHHVKDNETGEQNYRLDYETGWCMTYRGAIDAEIAQLRGRVIMRGERT